MTLVDDSIAVTFRPALQQTTVSLRAVRERLVYFLEHFCDVPLVDRSFRELLGGTTGEERFAALLERTGYVGRSQELLTELVGHLERASGGQGGPIELGGLSLPYPLLLEVLEVLVPGAGSVPIKRVDQLEELTNTSVPPSERERMQQILDLYPVRLSQHTIRQMRLSPAIARQYYPFVDELDLDGEIHTWVGQFFRGIVEQMYRNRVIFVMNMSCPVYCRFCFRKHKECRNQKAPSKVHVQQAVAYLREAPAVKEVVLTGGDPFMNRATLRYAIAELAKVPHLQTLRLASRAISYHPELFRGSEASWIHYLVRSNLELRETSKRLEVATHFIHPDEISIGALDVISQLVRGGIPVYVQTPFVQGCNESATELIPLFNALRAAGAEMHYMFVPTSPIRGNRTYWAPLSQGLRAARELRMRLSDRAIPHITTATSIGKIDWNTSGWAVEKDEHNPRLLWIRTPYSPEYYQPFAPILQLGGRVRQNAEGTLDATFMADIGDEAILAGPRVLASSPEAVELKRAKTEETTRGWLEVLEARCLGDQRDLDLSLGRPPAPCLRRNHWARAELDCGAPDSEIEQALAYLRAEPNVTDVVLSRQDDVLTGMSRTLEVIDRIQQIPHVVAVRLRSLKLVHAPEAFAMPVLERLAGRNKVRIIRPCRLEIETQLLHPSELGPEHAPLVRSLRMRGITVYANTPLLGLINDSEQDILGIAYRCRELGIEYGNVFVAGAPIQADWNDEHPIELNSVIDIASAVRREGSGREVPRYLLRTRLGEVDFSITPRIFSLDEDGQVWVTLRPHDLGFYRGIDPDFEWPDEVQVDEQGHPRVPVGGVSLEHQQFLLPPEG